MTKSRSVWVLGCAVGLTLLVGLVVALGAVFIPRIPEVAEQLPSGAAPLLVNLTTPLHGSQVLLDTPAAVYAEAVGEKPIAALELWVDGVSFGSQAPTSGSAATWFSASWAWAPAGAGEHVLFARAMDGDGHVATSNVVRVYALAPEEYPLAVGEPAPGAGAGSGGEGGLGAGEGPPPSPTSHHDPGGLPPEMQPGNDPSPDAPPPAAPPSGPTQPAPGGPPGKLAIWVRNLFGGAAAPPKAPEIAAAVEGCDVRLFVTDRADDEEGFFVYRLGPGDTAFQRIATLDDYRGSDPFVYADAGLYGKFIYYVAAFNTAGESPGQVTQPLEVNATECVSPQWTGLQLSGAKITTSQPVDELYCYTSFDKGPWTRLPLGLKTFIYPDPASGEFDLSDHFDLLATPPPQADVTLDLECWGWQGNTLIGLGRVAQTIGPAQFDDPIVVSGAGFSLVGLMTTQVLSGTFVPIPSALIAPPTNLRIITNLEECSMVSEGLGILFAPLFCGAAMDAGDTILAWDWSPTGGCYPAGSSCPYNVSDIGGYRIYAHYLGHAPKLIDTVTNPDQSLRGIPPEWVPSPDSGLVFIPPYYTVRAFNENNESADSNFVTWQPSARTIPLEPSYIAGWFAWAGQGSKGHWYDNLNPIELVTKLLTVAGLSGCPGGDSYLLYKDVPVCPTCPWTHVKVGFWHGVPGECYEKEIAYYRGIVRFDLTQVKGPVLSARLKADQLGEPACAYDGCGLTATNCGTFLMVDGADFHGPGLWLAEEGVDVTAPVRSAWLRGEATTPYFTLRGWDEGPSFDVNSCFVAFDNFVLEINTTAADDRYVMPMQTDPPWGAVGFNDNGCTGVLIDPEHVLAAAHCFVCGVEGCQGEWLRKGHFFPNYHPDRANPPYYLIDRAVVGSRVEVIAESDQHNYWGIGHLAAPVTDFPYLAIDVVPSSLFPLTVQVPGYGREEDRWPARHNSYPPPPPPPEGWYPTTNCWWIPALVEPDCLALGDTNDVINLDGQTCTLTGGNSGSPILWDAGPPGSPSYRIAGTFHGGVIAPSAESFQYAPRFAAGVALATCDGGGDCSQVFASDGDGYEVVRRYREGTQISDAFSTFKPMNIMPGLARSPGRIAAFKRTDNRPQVVVIDAHGRLYTSYAQSNGTWASWSELDKPAGVTGFLDVDAAYDADHTNQLFVVGDDHVAYTRRRLSSDPNAAWGGWQALAAPGGYSFERISAIRWADGTQQVFLVDAAGEAYTQWQTSATPDSGWEAVTPWPRPAEMSAIVDLDAGWNHAEQPQLFAVGVDGGLWTREMTSPSSGNAWQRWDVTLYAPARSTPISVEGIVTLTASRWQEQSGGAIVPVVLATDGWGNIYYTEYTSGAWQPWRSFYH